MMRQAYGRRENTNRMTRNDGNVLSVYLAWASQAMNDRAELSYRQAAFEALSYVWGVHARVALRIDVLAPSADPAMWDIATIRAFVDLRRVRPNVSWRIAHG
jgi:hypothetical protein